MIDYRNDFWETRKAGELQHLRAQARWWRKVHTAWLDHARRLIRGPIPAWLLDVGAGLGLFVDAASERGWVALGIEPSSAAIAEAGKFSNLVQCLYEDFEELEDWPSKHDVISAHWLMEHLLEPQHFLAWCDKYLEPGGLLMLAVPNEWSALQRAANRRTRRPLWWIHETHISYWNIADFEKLLQRNGWRVVSRMGTFPMELFILLGLDYVDRPRLGRMLHRIVETAELLLPAPILRTWYVWLGQMGIGRDMVFFCKRIKEDK